MNSTLLKQFIAAFTIMAHLAPAFVANARAATALHSGTHTGVHETCKKIQMQVRTMETKRVKVGYPEYQIVTYPPLYFLNEHITEDAQAYMVGGSHEFTYDNYSATESITILPLDGTAMFSALGTLDFFGGFVSFKTNGTEIFHQSYPNRSPPPAADYDVDESLTSPYPVLRRSAISAQVNSSNLGNVYISVAYQPGPANRVTNYFIAETGTGPHTIGTLLYEAPGDIPESTTNITPTTMVFEKFYAHRASQSHLRTNEYTTDLLESLARVALTNYCLLPDWNAGVFFSLETGCQGTNVQDTAYRHLNDPENIIVLRRLDFRFEVPDSEWGAKYVVHWNKIENGETNYGGAVHITGNGRTAYSTNVVLNPPEENGDIRPEIERIEETHRPYLASGPGGCSSGCSTRGGSSGPGSMAAGMGSVDISFDLGASSFEDHAGFLHIHEQMPSAELSTPALLQWDIDESSVTIFTNAYGLEEARAPQTVAVVTYQTAYKYSIAFSAKVGEVYLTNTPFVTYVIENPDGSTNNNRLRVVEQRSSRNITNDYVWSGTGIDDRVWQLTSGNGLRIQKLSEVSADPYIYRTYEIFNPGGASPIYKEVSTFRNTSIGDVLLTHVVDPGGLSITTSNSYTADWRLETQTLPNGSWIWNTYNENGKLFQVFSGFLNQSITNDPALTRVKTHYYTAVNGDDSLTESPWLPRTIIETNLGAEVSRKYFVYLANETREYVAQTAGAAWNASDTLATITRYWSTGDYAGDLKSIRNPDGTKTVYQYSTSSGEKTTAVLSGQEDTGNETNILKGTMVVTTVGPVGEPISHQSFDIATGHKFSSEVYSSYDHLSRPTLTTYLDGTTSSITYDDCCGVQTEIDKEGTSTVNTFDALRRLVATTRDSVTITNIYDAADNLLIQRRRASNPTQITLSATSYDKANRPLRITNALGQVTTISYVISNGYSLTTTTRLTNSTDGITRVETQAKDGSLVSLTGSSVYPVRYEFGVSAGQLYTKEIKLNDDYSDTAEWTQTFADMVGRNYKTLYPDSATSISHYNNAGQLVRTVDPDGVTTLFQYDGEGNVEFRAIDMNGNNSIDFGTTGASDRITQSRSFFTTAHGASNLVRRSEKAVFTTVGSSDTNVVSVTYTLTNGLRSWQHQGGVTNQIDVRYAGSGNRYVTNTHPNGATTTTRYLRGKLMSVREVHFGGGQSFQTSYGYDAHLRRTTITDARNGTTTIQYDDLDRPITVTTPAPQPHLPPLVTKTFYDILGNVSGELKPDGTTITNFYNARGELVMSYGSRSYPFEQGFDSQGRIVGLTNWAAFNTMSGARATKWLYHTERGWLTNKLYAGDTNGVRYTYSPAGRLNSRLWARGITTTYSPTAAGDVERIEYSDGITLNITNTYDRVGRLSQVKQGTNTTTFDYDANGRMNTEDFNGVSVTNGFDAAGRKNLMVMMAGASSNAVTYFYDTANRLRDVTNGTYNVRYSYFGNSRLVSSAAFRNNATTRMTTSRTYDRVDRLLKISSTGSGMVLPESYAYDYNSASQRVKTTLADGSYWVYKYDSMGQLTSGKKYWSDGTAVPGQQFEYGYDDIGNRTSTKEGGDQNGDGLRSSSYSATALNQYSSRTNAPGIDILGVANASATVTVSNQSTYRKGEYFQKALAINNAGGAVYSLVTNIATLSGVTNVEWGKAYVPPATESYIHDKDGNLTQDARWNYTWDAENRLINQEARNGSDPTANIAHGYDYRSRRITIKVTETGGGLSTNRFIYNGWNVIAEFNGSGVLQKSFVWGKDLSGSEHGAGGVGGLVMLVLHTGGNSGTYFPTYDGNGNLTALWKGSESSSGIKARYEYDPFHNVLRATGDIAKENNHLAATKYYNWRSGQYYYGFRHYDPDTGRWLSNDPIGERGGQNLYVLVRNGPIFKYDYLGLAEGNFQKICDLSKELDGRMGRLNQNNGERLMGLFLQLQNCILRKLCEGKCCDSSTASASWLNNVTADFMSALFRALDGQFGPDNQLWKNELERIRKLDKEGNERVQQGVAMRMAIIHINQDLRNALLNHGVGKDSDWKCVGNQVRDCENENFKRLDRFLNDLFMSPFFDVAEIRDQMREAVKNGK